MCKEKSCKSSGEILKKIKMAKIKCRNCGKDAYLTIMGTYHCSNCNMDTPMEKPSKIINPESINQQVMSMFEKAMLKTARSKKLK